MNLTQEIGNLSSMISVQNKSMSKDLREGTNKSNYYMNKLLQASYYRKESQDIRKIRIDKEIEENKVEITGKMLVDIDFLNKGKAYVELPNNDRNVREQASGCFGIKCGDGRRGSGPNNDPLRRVRSQDIVEHKSSSYDERGWGARDLSTKSTIKKTNKQPENNTGLISGFWNLKKMLW